MISGAFGLICFDHLWLSEDQLYNSPQSLSLAEENIPRTHMKMFRLQSKDSCRTVEYLSDSSEYVLRI